MKKNTKKIAVIGILTAIVVVLQFVSMAIRTGWFSITLSLVPILVGAAMYGKYSGAWLGGAFGLTVLLTGDANAFLAINPVGTVVTVMLKGIMAGFVAGLVFELIYKKNSSSNKLATFCAAVITPVVNTGLFIVGCYVFFYSALQEMAGGANVFVFIVTALISFNFFIELGVNLVLLPVIIRLVTIGRKEIKK